MIVEIFGVLATGLTMTLDLPQLIKIFKTKSVGSFSLATLILKWLCLVSWLVYGILLGNVPLTVTNVVSVACATLYLYFYFKYKTKLK